MSPDESLIQTQLAVARIEGMLTQVIAGHDARLVAVELRLTTHDERLNEKKALLARLDERVLDIEEDNSARAGRIFGSVGMVVSILTAILAIANRLTLTP